MPDIKLDTLGDWYSVNSLSGIAVGTKIKLQNKGEHFVTLQESPTKPVKEDSTGENMTGRDGTEASKIQTAGSPELWFKGTGTHDTSVYLFVQEI